MDGSRRGRSSLNKGEEEERSVDAAFHSEWMSPVYTLNSVRPILLLYSLPPTAGTLAQRRRQRDASLWCSAERARVA